MAKFQRCCIPFNSTEMQRKITCIYGLYSAVKWQYFLSQYHCLHLFSIKMLPYGNVWNRFSGWNSFMVIIPYRLYWKYCSVLCCLAMLDSVACYFLHLSPSVLTPFSCRLYFCGLRSNTQKTFLSIFPDENECLSAATLRRCSSFYPHLTQRGRVKHSTMACGVIILYCLILQILWFNCLYLQFSYRFVLFL